MHVAVKHSISKQDSETVNKWHDCQTYFMLPGLTINCSKKVDLNAKEFYLFSLNLNASVARQIQK